MINFKQKILALGKTKIMFLSFVLFCALSFTVSLAYFKTKSRELVMEREATTLTGSVAGSQNTNSDQLPNNIPLMQNSEILSIDKSNEATYILLESKNSDADINEFYNEFFTQNGWKKSDKTYSLKKQTVKIEINNAIVKITTNF